MIRQLYYKKVIVITLCVVVFMVSCRQSAEKQLPVYNPSDFNQALVDKSLRETNKDHRISDFNLINQNGKTVTQDDYQDKIYVADFFFTSCQGPCPIMTSNMAKVQEAFVTNDDIMFLSLSVTPDIDSIPKLREYATQKGVIDSKWNVTTGEKKHIYELARKSYFAVEERGDGGLQDFIHTSNFILVDKKKRIRGIYDGLDNKEIRRLIYDINMLIN